MEKRNRLERGVFTLLAVTLILGLCWITCTQKSPVDSTGTLQEEIPLLTGIVASPSQIPVGGAQSNIRVRLVDQDGQALNNQVVTFSTNLGSVTSQDTTDANGWADAVLTSTQVAGQAKVTARYGSLASASVTIIILSSHQAQIKIESDRDKLIANGIDATTITVTLSSDSAKPAVGAVVSFSSTCGSIPSSVTTDESGKGSVSLTSIASFRDTTAIVMATYDTLSVALVVLFQGVQFAAGAAPTTILADGESTSTITAILKETTSQIAISGANIRFGTNLGTIPNEETTNAEGVARVTLTSGTATGTAHVIVLYGQTIEDTVDVVFSTEAPSIHTLSEIGADPNRILANGVDRSTISARVVDDDQNPVSGIVVSYSTTAGTIPSQGVTGEDGFATVDLTSEARDTDITATVTAQLSTQSMQTTVSFEGVELNCGASPTTIIANGQSTSTITAVLKRTTTKVAISGATIVFGTDLGTIPSQGITNMAGVAQVLLTSETTTGTAHVTIRYGATIEDTVEVVFQESIPTYIEVSATPSVIPADGQSQSTIRAALTDANRNPVPDGMPVVFDIAEGSGTIGSYGETVGGVATSILTSSTFPDTTKVSVTSGSLSDTVVVYYTVGEASQILVSADRDSLPADGMSMATVEAKVLDAQGHALEGLTVNFSASIGDITQNAITNSGGIATAQYSSSTVGTAVITASVDVPGGGSVSNTTIIRLLPGDPTMIILWFDPTSMGVKETGQNQTVTCYAEVRDDKNNPVKDGTYVLFTIYHGPGGGEFLSPEEPIPTVNGVAHVSFSSGIRSGAARIQAEVTDSEGTPLVPSVKAISTELIIHAGPPYITDVNDLSTTHLTIVAKRLNIWAGMDTTLISIMVGDKYNNPVQEGTAVYMTTSGGVINTHTAYTDEYGKANVILTAGNPLPTIDRFYNYIGMQDPNTGESIGDHISDPLIPDFESSQVQNSEGDFGENDGIARIIAYTEGVDSSGNSARPWDWGEVVFSEAVDHFVLLCDDVGDTLSIGKSTTITIEIWDRNGNSIVGGSILSASVFPEDAQVGLEWKTLTTLDPGQCYYSLTIVNSIDPQEPQFMIIGAYITIEIESTNGSAKNSIGPIYMDIN